ncbi:MAG TPA: hypothetical protein VFY62_13905, partial [Pseudomonas sp.]|nr:hypothetical protein [Pseudomonas sp.]
GSLSGEVPAHFQQELVVEIQAVDAQGQRASTVLTLKSQAAAGRASLDQQFDRFGLAQQVQQQEMLRQQLETLAQLQPSAADQTTSSL